MNNSKTLSLVSGLFARQSEFLNEFQKKGVSTVSNDFKHLKAGSTFGVLRTALKVLSEEAVDQLRFADPTDAPYLAKCQAYASLLDCIDQIVDVSSDTECMIKIIQGLTEEPKLETKQLQSATI